MSKLIVLILTATLALAQDHWTTVTRIPAGASTKVKRQGVRKRISGTFAGANADAIQINGQGGVTSIPRSEVEQVSVARKRKARNTLIGAAIGGGVGAGIMGGITAIDERNNDGEKWAGVFAVVGLVLGSGIGAAFGAVSGSGYAPVYEVAKPR